MPELKESAIRLIPYGTNKSLELLGEARCLIKAEVGVEMITRVNVIRGVQESLLGLRDGENLGILKIRLKGNTARTGADPPPGAETRGRQTQEQIDQSMMEAMKLFQKALSELGGQREVPNIQGADEQTGKGVTTLQTGRNADTRSTGKAGEQLCSQDPMLKHEMQGSDRFSIIDFNHTICQSLGQNTDHRNTCRELREKIREMIEGLEGVIQIEDDVMIHRKGKEHDDRLRKLRARLHNKE